ncbi:7TM-DISM domain-containing protein [Dokdonia sp. Hel_I_53]|uniref:7TM-DISM domain-containing protein n=1 Tax=Dokdonia sp. Hel_I_53 TaxID=1566287 RepID=UPI00119997D0|nr:7TM-DISM domain-containing protein [Dokdonia sp. Hel_I_53]TVZ51535.1 7TMR-DISM extracellular protein 2 [Dokdonia sp. Hel_I_53]
MRLLVVFMTLILSSSTDELDLYSYYRDVTGDLTFEDVKFKNFTDSKTNNLGAANGVYWFKIKESIGPRSILEMRSAHVNGLTLYDSANTVVQPMDDTRFPSYFLINKQLTYPLYLKSNFPLEAYFPIHILTESSFASNDKHSFLGIGLFYGTAIALLIATLTFFFIVRNTQFLVFAVLIVAIILSVIGKDNILYFFNFPYEVSSILEAVGHCIVGLSATCFMMFYLRIRPHQQWIKWAMLSMSSVSVLALVIFAISGNLYAYSIVDISGLITVGFMWVLILIIAKGIRRLTLVFVYSINLFFITDIFIFHTYGIEIVKFGITGISILAISNFTLIAVLLLFSLKNIQTSGVIMKHRIKLYVERLKELDNYKIIQDANDEYLESLIYQYKLENIEVKVLGDISKGLSNDHIAHKYNLTEEKLQNITNALYLKLGLESSKDITQLAH